MKNTLISLLLLCVGICAGMMLEKSHSKPQILTHTIVRDTTIIDTFFVDKPVPYKVVVRDTLFLSNDDGNNDSGQVFVHEIKQYKDSILTAQVSGINAHLDWYQVNRPTVTKTVTNTVYIPPKKWSIGLQGGVGITPKGLQPYLGVGIGYKIEF